MSLLALPAYLLSFLPSAGSPAPSPNGEAAAADDDPSSFRTIFARESLQERGLHTVQDDGHKLYYVRTPSLVACTVARGVTRGQSTSDAAQRRELAALASLNLTLLDPPSRPPPPRRNCTAAARPTSYSSWACPTRPSRGRARSRTLPNGQTSFRSSSSTTADRATRVRPASSLLFRAPSACSAARKPAAVELIDCCAFPFGRSWQATRVLLCVPQGLASPRFSVPQRSQTDGLNTRPALARSSTRRAQWPETRGLCSTPSAGPHRSRCTSSVSRWVRPPPPASSSFPCRPCRPQRGRWLTPAHIFLSGWSGWTGNMQAA